MGDDNYGAVKKGALKFKGDKGDLRKQKKKEKKKERATQGHVVKVDDDADEVADVISGSGRLLATGTTVHGFDTKFLDEIAVGDSLLVQHPSSQVVEQIQVSHVLTNKSLTILEPFSSDFSSTAVFHVSKDSVIFAKKMKREAAAGSKEEVTEEELMRRQMEKELEKRMKKQNRIIKVKKKVYGGGGVTYRTVEKKMDRAVTAEDALDERVKLGRDKYCR